MAPSEATGPLRRPRSPGRTLLFALLAVVAVVVLWQVAVFVSVQLHFGSGYDRKQFDRLESQFERDRAAFTAADARMRSLVGANPGAARIAWTGALTCVRAQGQGPADESCTDTTAADRALFEALPAADVVLAQAKDGGRTFFRFHGDDPPLYTIMSAPYDDDPSEYADDHGFRSTRDLSDGWTLLGPIPDLKAEDAQWP